MSNQTYPLVTDSSSARSCETNKSELGVYLVWAKATWLNNNLRYWILEDYRCTFGPLNLARSLARPFGPVRGTARSVVCGPRAARPVAGPSHGPHPRPAARWWPGPVSPWPDTTRSFCSICCDFVLFLFDITCELRYVLLETIKLYAASFICCDL